jgi:CubicO group peptidase (beta-lactamase class C family)
MAERDITGASIALIDGEDIVWSGGFGCTNRSANVKVTGDTLFHVGSISKSFTALGALKAVAQNLIALDDPLKKYLPWFFVNSRFGTAAFEQITIRHLLAHHSGLGTWSPLRGHGERNMCDWILRQAQRANSKRCRHAASLLREVYSLRPTIWRGSLSFICRLVS